MKNNGIGLNGQMPWPRIPKEMKHFADITTSKEPFSFTNAEAALKNCFFQSALNQSASLSGIPATSKLNAVIMGRKTWDSLPAKYRPLPNRINVVLSRNSTASQLNVNDENGMVEVFSDFEIALNSLSQNPKVNEIFVIGGANIYEQALK